jgi:alkylation response protein AidB-like acyl-CoA dehydrogenase
MQLIQGKIADMYTITSATRAFVYKTAAEADAGVADRKDCAAVILYAAEHATRMALDAIQVGICQRILCGLGRLYQLDDTVLCCVARCRTER